MPLSYEAVKEPDYASYANYIVIRISLSDNRESAQMPVDASTFSLNKKKNLLIFV